MTINRRDFLTAGAAMSVGSLLAGKVRAAVDAVPSGAPWRRFKVTTRIEIAHPAGAVQAWIPLPSVSEADWVRPLGNRWTTAGKAEVTHDPNYGAAMLHIAWAGGEAPVVEVMSAVALRDRSVPLDRPGSAWSLSADDRTLYTKPTDLIPTDGIVKETADRITAGAATELDKARAIYEWIVDNTFRDPKVRGCGLGDIVFMLRSGDLRGKCADINALYVGLARASGLPARDLYGIRVAPSQRGYKSLGANSAVISKAQHCRAEVYLDGFGWVPVDPADVRKVVLEEPPGNLPLGDPKVVDARARLFGSWETNWLPYNTAHDVALPGSGGPKLGFLMYPQAETAAGRIDCLDPDAFAYKITAEELNAA